MTDALRAKGMRRRVCCKEKPLRKKARSGSAKILLDGQNELLCNSALLAAAVNITPGFVLIPADERNFLPQRRAAGHVGVDIRALADVAPFLYAADERLLAAAVVHDFGAFSRSGRGSRGGSGRFRRLLLIDDDFNEKRFCLFRKIRFYYFYYDFPGITALLGRRAAYGNPLTLIL